MSKMAVLLTTDNFKRIFKSRDQKVKELLLDLVKDLDYYGVESFKRQLTEYANGQRSTNIGDGMLITLSRINSAVENSQTYYEMVRQEHENERKVTE